MTIKIEAERGFYIGNVELGKEILIPKGDSRALNFTGREVLVTNYETRGDGKVGYLGITTPPNQLPEIEGDIDNFVRRYESKEVTTQAVLKEKGTARIVVPTRDELGIEEHLESFTVTNLE